MSTKRPAPQDDSVESSDKKVHFEPRQIGPVSTQEETDMKVLQLRNKKLTEGLEQRQGQETDLRFRIKQLEKRQTGIEAVLCVVDRYLNQLTEDLRTLLQRFEAETSDESETLNEEEATPSFLALLGQLDKKELEEKSAQLVQASTLAVSEFSQTLDQIVQKNHEIMLDLKGDPSSQETIPSLDDVGRLTNVDLQNENENLPLLVTGLREKHHQMSLKLAQAQDKLAALEKDSVQLKNHLKDLKYNDGNASPRKSATLPDPKKLVEASSVSTESIANDPLDLLPENGGQDVEAELRPGDSLDSCLPNLFQGSDAVEKLRNDPRTKDFFKDTSYVNLIMDLHTNPTLMMDKMRDHRVLIAFHVLSEGSNNAAASDGVGKETKSTDLLEPVSSKLEENLASGVNSGKE